MLFRFNAPLWIAYRDQIVAAVADYARRTGDRVDPGAVWEAVHAALVHDQGAVLALGAADGDDLDLVGYCLCTRNHPPASPPFVAVWMVWVRPGRARLADLYDDGLAAIRAWAAGAPLMAATYRMSPAYRRLLARLGWRHVAEVWEHD